MSLRVRLSNPVTNNVLTLQETDPGQLDQFTSEVKRSRDNAGVVFNFTVDLEFNKDGRAFIQDVYETQGIDGSIQVDIYEYKPNRYRWELEYTGELDLREYEITETKVAVNVEKVSFERKFLSLIDLDVDLEATQSYLGVSLPQTPTIDLPYHAKVIRKQATIEGPSAFVQSGFTPGFASYIRLGGSLNNSDFDEAIVSTSFWTTPASATEKPPDIDDFSLLVTEPGEYTFDFSQLNFDWSIEVANIFPPNTPNLTSWTVKVIYQKNNETPVEVYNQNFTPADFDQTVLTEGGNRTKFTKLNESPSVPQIVETLSLNDKVFIWIDSGIDFAGAGDSSKDIAYRLTEDSFFSISADTVFPGTNAKSIMVHEAIEKICQVITDQPVAFRSSVLGRTDTSLSYPIDGPLSLIAFTNGRNLRQSSNQQLFASFSDMIESLNAKRPIDWGFETLEDGTRIIVVEDKSYFYDKNNKILELGVVSNPKMKARKDLYYAQVEVKYPKIENINQVNGIDEFNTVRRWGSPVVRSEGKLTLNSVYRSGGLEIESQRRLLGSTEESRLDDEGFLTAVIRDGFFFRSEQDENYPLIEGVVDPATTYNMTLAPRRNLENWKEVLASNVARSANKVFKFTYGEINYLVNSQRTGETAIAENQDLDLTGVEPLWYNDTYTFETDFTSEQFRIIENNPYGYIAFQDWNNNLLEGYLDSCKFNYTQQKAEFELLRVFRAE